MADEFNRNLCEKTQEGLIDHLERHDDDIEELKGRTRSVEDAVLILTKLKEKEQVGQWVQLGLIAVIIILVIGKEALPLIAAAVLK